MPKQYVVFGRPVPRLGTRHITLLLGVVSLFALFSLIFTLPRSSIPTAPSIPNPKFAVPESLKTPPSWMTNLNPFKQPAHAPPRQQNDTDGESSWYSNYKWLVTPFSSSVTLDENRSLLPVLEKRPPIYCYYDNTVKKTDKEKDAESELLLAWRRAWWAQGFRPIILSPAEGKSNPLYDDLQRHTEMKPELRTDLMRWLAWENMSGGLLAHYLLFPMGAHDDPLLASLRRGEYPVLTKWKDLDDGLFAGPQKDIATAIKLALASPHLKLVKDILSALPAGKDSPFAEDDRPKSLAYYQARVIEANYPNTAEKLVKDTAAGFRDLTQLITSHLHQTWQGVFSSGIAVLKPLAHHTTHLITPAYELARRLGYCPASPDPTSCPPNRPKCTPCDGTHDLQITTPAHYSNATTLYTIATVPHPYTSSSLHSMQEKLDVSWIRRESPRDSWIADLTESLAPKGISGGARLLRFKEAVASPAAAARSLWLLAERDLPEDLDWHFGFKIPPGGGGLAPQHDEADGPVPSSEDLAREPDLLTRAQAVVGTGDGNGPIRKAKKVHVTKDQVAVRSAVEAWNLADTEAWRFARAYLARLTMERKKWEETEAKYADGMGSERGRRSPLDRWLE